MNNSCPEFARQGDDTRLRLEHFQGGKIDLDAWCDFLDPRLSPEDQDNADLVRRAWGEYLLEHDPVAYRNKLADAPAPPRALPGTEEKILEMTRRVRKRRRTDHPADPGIPD